VGVVPDAPYFLADILQPSVAVDALSAFAPSPPTNGQGTSISAGHSPDGRVQLWMYGDDGTLRTTWKKTGDPNSGWFPWEPFPAAGNFAPPVGQLKDGRMQLFGTGPQQFVDDELEGVHGAERSLERLDGAESEPFESCRRCRR
jgi:hypothetical protein